MDYKTILVTGGAGFVGSNLAVALKERFPRTRVIAFDNLRRRGGELNIPRLKECGIKFVHGDIRNAEDVAAVRDFDVLLECSAEPSVLSGYNESPGYVINTNLIGTVNCLEAARRNKADVVFLSTSRVYPYDRINGLRTRETARRIEWDMSQAGKIPGWSVRGIAEGFPLAGPRSMYGATKLCSEYLLTEYISMYGLRGVINRCGVIAGPWQFGKVDQGVFTLWMLAHYFKRPLSYIGFGGSGKQVRDVLHIDDLAMLVIAQLKNMQAVNGEIFNVGGGRDISLSLRETTAVCERITGNRIRIGRDRKTRPADVPLYLTDTAKVRKALGWQPHKSASTILQDIYRWIRENESIVKNIL